MIPMGGFMLFMGMGIPPIPLPFGDDKEAPRRPDAPAVKLEYRRPLYAQTIEYRKAKGLIP